MSGVNFQFCSGCIGLFSLTQQPLAQNHISIVAVPVHISFYIG